MAADVVMSGTGDFELPPRKKPKIGELPLSSAQRASIDGMLHTFKKKGEFDGLRKRTFQQYNESAQRGMFEAALRSFTTTEIDRDPIKYLKPDRRMGAPLLEGAAARSDVYKRTEADIEAYIDQYLGNAESVLRDIRRKEVGDEAAAEEAQRGRKSDETYAEEAEARRVLRAKKHADEAKLRKKQEAQERKKKELEALKKKQEELMKETEKLQREQKRRAERDAWKAAEKERERERIRKFNEDREKLKQETEERERAAKEERDRRQREKNEREQKRLEEEALDLLLKEGQAMAEKARRPELERSESMEPPSRLTKLTRAPRNSITRDEMRAQGLMPTSMTLRKGDKQSTPSVPTGPASAVDEGKSSRVRSPSPIRSTLGRSRRETPPRDDARRPSRRDDVGRGAFGRDVSHERQGWKARPRERAGSRERGEEGEVIETTRASTRIRSRSRESHRERRRRDSRSPPRRRYRDDSRSRSPPRRRGYRDDPRRERSRSPPGIDRYVPGGGGGGGGGGGAGGGGGGGAARRPRDDDDRDMRRRRDDDDREHDRRSRRGDTRYNDDRRKDSEIDRYIPGGGARAAAEEEKPRRRERSRSKHREKSRERERTRSPGRRRRDERERGGMREREREKEVERPRDRAERPKERKESRDDRA